MKTSPIYKKAYENMSPGRIVKEGFLGDDKRTLADIISEDEKTMKFLNLEFEVLTEKLKYLLQESIPGLGEPVTVDGKWHVRVDEARGKLPCPFEDKIFYKKTINVINIKTRESFFISDLAIHLIEEHHFFQGKGSTFRLEPEILKRILEL